jgi:hypothetical protein
MHSWTAKPAAESSTAGAILSKEDARDIRIRLDENGKEKPLADASFLSLVHLVIIRLKNYFVTEPLLSRCRVKDEEARTPSNVAFSIFALFLLIILYFTFARAFKH